MSFKFNWPEFDEEFVQKAQEQLTAALNKTGDSDKPANIVDKIVVTELNMGTKPPDLEILEIGELTEHRFRGIFKFTYNGDASLVLQTKVQANPLTSPKRPFLINPRQGFLAAHKPLVVPMQLRISHLKLRGICVFVFDKIRGITLCFKNDPLEKVHVSSTFDTIPNIRRFLQNTIEKQLRKLLQEDLPGIVHTLSLRFIHSKIRPIPHHFRERNLGNNHQFSTARKMTDSAYASLATSTESLSMPSINLAKEFSSRWHGNEIPERYDSINMTDRPVAFHKPLRPTESRTHQDGLHRLFDPKIDGQHAFSRQDLWSSLNMGTYASYAGSPRLPKRARRSSLRSVQSLPAIVPSRNQYDLQTLSHGSPIQHFHSSHHYFAVSQGRQHQHVQVNFPQAIHPRDGAASHNPDADEFFNEEFFDENTIVLEPSRSSSAAHLTQLLNSHQTIFPYVSLVEKEDYFRFRSSPSRNKGQF